MEEKRVIVIEPTVKLTSDFTSEDFVKKRVCAYARVSTDTEDQLNSYNVQIDEYTQRIKENPEWTFVGMYADEGISGTSMKKRPNFMRLIRDAENGLIDLVLTKSISRFSRNTVDSLQVIQKFREIGVEVYFEKENLYSSDTKVDFMLTIFSSIAQEEARNISENVKWGYRKRFKEGKVTINTTRFLGYDKDENKKIIINKKQAKTVKKIFNMYMSGESANSIAKILTEFQFVNGRGEVKWTSASINGIITNEKYCGDALLQKRVVVDYLTHKSIRNNGHAPQYYVMNNHEPIIPREMFEVVQLYKKDRAKKGGSTYKKTYPFTGQVTCSECGRTLNRHYYNYNRPSKRVVLTCKNKYKSNVQCNMKAIDNDTLTELTKLIIKKLDLNENQLLEHTIVGLQKHISEVPVFETIVKKRADIKILEKELKNILNLQVKDAQDSRHYEQLYFNKKEQIDIINIEITHLQENLTKGYRDKSKLDSLHEFLIDKEDLTYELVDSLFFEIIQISSTEIKFNLRDIAAEKSIILNDTFTSSKTNMTLKYTVEGGI